MTIQKTRGNLAPAAIVNHATKQRVNCMFNPFEYTLTKSNSYAPKPAKGKNVPKTVFTGGGKQVLKLALHFDTQDTGTDVRDMTDPLWALMMVDEEKENPRSGKSSPPEVAFEWGKLYFKAYITNLSQKFTLFKDNGTPLRCTVDITLEQFEDVNDYQQEQGAQQAQKTVAAIAGDRPDNVAAKGGDANAMRQIAEANNIDNPLKTRPGQNIRV